MILVSCAQFPASRFDAGEGLVGVEAQSSAEGRFSFEGDMLPDLSSGAVVIATLLGYAAGGADLLPDSSQSLEIRLEPAEPVEVKVLEATGGTVAGARVRQRIAIEALSQRPVPRYQYYLGAQGLTGTDGLVQLPPVLGEQMIWAEKNDLVSVPWRGARPTTITLQLGNSFTLEGTVTSVPPLDVRDGYRIRIFGQTGNLWRTLDTLDGVSEGPWGPMLVPIDGVSSYRVRLEGDSIVPAEESFASPRSGTQRRVDLLARGGHVLQLSVTDEAEKPIESAACVVWWAQSVQPDDVQSKQAVADQSGVISVGGLPSGLLQYRVSAPGFAFCEYWAETPQVEPISVTLTRGGRVVGRCLHEGEPVPDFEIIYWKEGNPRIDQRQPFQGREDGRFEIDHLSPGGWFFQGASPSYPSGSPVSTRVEVDHVVEVEIDLPTALSGGGRVLDAKTGDGISAARVQPYSSGGTQLTFPWGPPVVADDQGIFELSAFVPGANFIRVDADGFASSFAKANAEPDGFVDWGEIRLHRPQRLRLTLLGLDELTGAAASEFKAGTVDGHMLPDKSFEADGTVQYEEVPPGVHKVFVYYPDDSWARMQLQLEPGSEWEYDLKVGGTQTLDVLVLDARGEKLPFAPQVMVIAQEETGTLVVRMKVADRDGSASFAGIRADDVQVWILDWNQAVVGSRDISVSANSGQRVEIRLDGKQFRVRILNRKKVPLPGAVVTIRSDAGDQILGVQTTSTDGWAPFFGIREGPVLMDIGHGLEGRRFGVPIDASLDEVEFVLEADGILELELRDGELPLAGVTVQMQTESGVTLSERKQTGQDGRARFEPLGEGRYHLACHRADCWPVVVTRDLALSEHALVPIEMRRVADLELFVTNTEGLPVAGVELDLRANEVEGEVARWIEEERVQAPSGLATDSRGVLRIKGLPRGHYTWMIETGSVPLSGSFELLPARENTVRVLLPD